MNRPKYKYLYLRAKSSLEDTEWTLEEYKERVEKLESLISPIGDKLIAKYVKQSNCKRSIKVTPLEYEAVIIALGMDVAYWPTSNRLGDDIDNLYQVCIKGRPLEVKDDKTTEV